MRNATHIVSAIVLISASLGLAACQGQTTLGEGLGDADQSVCAHGEFTTLANDPQSAQGNPLNWFALNGGRVFWYDQGGDGAIGDGPAMVKRVSESGGTPTTLAASTNVPAWADPQDILSQPVLDDTNLYWVRDNFDPTSKVQVSWSVVSVPQAGGAETTLFTSQEDLGGLYAADGESLYFSSTDENFPRLTKLFSVPEAGGPSKLLATFTGSGSNPMSSDYIGEILVDATNLYFPYGGKLFSMPKGGGGPVTLSTEGSGSIIQDATHLYWQEVNGDILSVAKTGGPVTTLATGFTPTGFLADDSACVYWIEGHDTVYAAPKAGGQVIVAAATSQLMAPQGVAADATGVYVADANGFILKLAR